MPIEKPTKPTELIPRAFGGIKNNFSDDLQSTGFEPNIPQTYNGDNLNYHLDATGKELDYVEKIVDFINQTPVNHVPFINENNQLDYVNKDELGGGGLEIGDISIAPLGIDETKNKRRYLNGQIIIQEQFESFTTKLKNAIALYPSLACTENDWQTKATMTVGGQVGKFVVDDEGGTIRLPKIIMPIQGLTNLANLAEIVEAGLPNIEGKFNSAVAGIGGTIVNATGAFVKTGNYDNFTAQNTGSNLRNYNWEVTLNASLSNSIYANSDTVQQEQIQYPYFIQVATGAETEDNIINEIELNNPYTLFDSKYNPNALYNASWLKSEGQYNSGAVYVTCYEGLLVEYNTNIEVGTTTTLPSGTDYTKKGLSVKLNTETFDDYDFVLNTSEETFRLPLLDGSESLPSNRYDDLTLGDSETSYTAPANGYVFFNGYFSSSSGVFRITSLASSMGSSVTGGDAYGKANRTFLPVKAGDIFNITYSDLQVLYQFRFIYAQGNGSLYYYVGETVQNANLINAGRIEETLVNKADINANNFTASGKSSIVGFCTPSSKRVILTIGASIAKYTAPANGYFVATVHGETGKYFYLRCPEAKMRTGGAYAGMAMDCFLPIKKGHTLEVHYSSLTRTELFCFVYAEGEV